MRLYELFICSIYLYICKYVLQGAIIGSISSVILTFWLGVGKNFSKSLKKTPWATMPPVDNCPVYGNSTLNNFTMTTDYSAIKHVTTEAIEP
jgi:hypothetical protein